MKNQDRPAFDRPSVVCLALSLTTRFGPIAADDCQYGKVVYGVAKAGKENDCAGSLRMPCAGQSKEEFGQGMDQKCRKGTCGAHRRRKSVPPSNDHGFCTMQRVVPGSIPASAGIGLRAQHQS